MMAIPTRGQTPPDGTCDIWFSSQYETPAESAGMTPLGTVDDTVNRPSGGATYLVLAVLLMLLLLAVGAGVILAGGLR